jgi:hypothetical protein
VTLIILRVADLAAALLDGPFEHPEIILASGPKTQKPTCMRDILSAQLGWLVLRPASRGKCRSPYEPMAWKPGIPPIRDRVTQSRSAASPCVQDGPCIIWMNWQRQGRLKDRVSQPKRLGLKDP